MSQVLAQFREENPVYKDSSDGRLAFGLWRQHYKDAIGMGEFADKVGLSNDDFGIMIASGKQLGHKPTTEVGADPVVETGGVVLGTARSLAQGFLAGGADEVVASSAAAVMKISGDERPFADIYSDVNSQENARLSKFSKENTGLAVGAEISGSIISPLAKLTRLAQLQKVGVYGNAALQSAAFAVPYAFLSKDGSITERADAASSVAIPAAIFGAAGQSLVNISKPLWDKVFNTSVKMRTIENLKAAKDKAYKLTKNQGIKFPHKEVNQMVFKAFRSIQEKGEFDAVVDKQAASALRHLHSKIAGSKRKGGMTLPELDRLQQAMWKRHGSAKGAEKGIILDMINGIDDLILKSPNASDAMQAARLANSRYKKAETIEQIFKGIDRDALFKGVDTVVKYKTAISRILQNPKQGKWFNQTEKDAMEAFVAGTTSQSVLASIGKLSFTTNSFMAGLNMAAIATNPALVALSVTATTAKTLSEVATKGHKASLEALIRGAQIKPQELSNKLAPIVGSLQGQNERETN